MICVIFTEHITNLHKGMYKYVIGINIKQRMDQQKYHLLLESKSAFIEGGQAYETPFKISIYNA